MQVVYVVGIPYTEGHSVYDSIYMKHPGAGGRGNRGQMLNGYGVSFWGDENVLESEVVVTQRCENTKCY